MSNIKFYTEDQVRKAMRLFLSTPQSSNEILEQLTPIELPSDEEIRMQTQFTTSDIYTKRAFFSGANWLKEQIENQNI